MCCHGCSHVLLQVSLIVCSNSHFERGGWVKGCLVGCYLQPYCKDIGHFTCINPHIVTLPEWVKVTEYRCSSTQTVIKWVSADWSKIMDKFPQEINLICQLTQFFQYIGQWLDSMSKATRTIIGKIKYIFTHFMNYIYINIILLVWGL